MQGTKLIFGTYNTMPEGAAATVFEMAYQTSWRPFLSGLYKFPSVNATLFYSGTVLSWIEENHPEFILLLEEMAARRQIELLGGGYHNPLFAALQPADKVGQIELLTTYLRKTFGRRPSGGWLYEYNWDSTIPLVFRNSGIGYSFLPREVLLESGCLDPGSLSPLVTEDQRKTLFILPVFDLEDTFGAPPTFEVAFDRLSSDYPEARILTIMADGHSIPSMWENSGLESPDVMFEKTFAALQKNLLSNETILAQSYVKTIRGGSLFYLSSASSARLRSSVISNRSGGGGGALSAPSFARGAILGNPASKRLYDKMYHVHSLMSLVRGDKARKKSAQEDLWRAQSGDAYWEGRLGGVRRPEVRIAAFKALIEAEKATRIHSSFSPGIVLDDLDCDGEREALYQSADMNCYMHSRGASVFELDSFRSRHNYCSSYPGAGETRFPSIFVDRIFACGSYRQEIISLADLSFNLAEKERSSQKVSYSREFQARIDDANASLFVRKTYLFQKFSVSLDVELINRSASQVNLRYSLEFNLRLPGSFRDLRCSVLEGRRESEVRETCGILEATGESVELRSAEAKEYIELRSPQMFHTRMSHFIDDRAAMPAQGYPDPRSGAGLESGCAGEGFFQGTNLILGWDVQIPADGIAPFSLTLHFNS